MALTQQDNDTLNKLKAQLQPYANGALVAKYGTPSPQLPNINSVSLAPTPAIKLPQQPPVNTGIADNAGIPSPLTQQQILAQGTAPTEHQGLFDQLNQSYAQLLGTQQSPDQLLAQQEQQKNVANLQSGADEIASQIEALNNQSLALQNEAANIPAQIESKALGQEITKGGAAHITAEQLRMNQSKQLALASQALTLKSAYYAANGKLATAQKAAETAAKLQYDYQTQQINYKKVQLQALEPILSREEKKQAAVMQAQLDENRRNADHQYEDHKSGIALIATAMANNPGNKQAQLAAQQAQQLSPTDPQYMDKVLNLVGKYQKDPIAVQTALYQQRNARLQGDKLQQEISQAGTGASFDTTTPQGQLAAMAQNLASKFNSKFSQEQFLSNVKRIAATGDQQQLADYVFSEAISNIGDADTRKRAFSNYNLTQKLATLKSALSQYYSLGGQTGLFQGTKEDIAAKLGTVSDTRLRSLGTTINDTLDQLARSRTGAVINEEEQKFYQRLLPGISKTAELNDAVINGLSSSLSTDLNNILKFQLTGSGFKNIEPYLSTPSPSAPDIYAKHRSQLQKGEILIQRGNVLMAVQPNELKPSDKKL